MGGASARERQWCIWCRMWEATNALLVASSTLCSASRSSAARGRGKGKKESEE
jgi:hypothetical protein